MTAFFALIVIYMAVSKIGAENINLYNNNGWRPLTNEKILSNYYKDVVKTEEAAHSVPNWNPVVHTDESNEENTYPQDFNDRRNMIESKEIQMRIAGIEPETNIEDQYTRMQQGIEANVVDKPSAIRPRKAKRILANAYNAISHLNGNHHDNVISTTKDVNTKNNDTISDETNNTYEVTEASEASEVADRLSINHKHNIIIKEDNRRQIDPSYKATNEKSLSNILFSILSNYNIRANDGLTNYALSRNKYKTPIKATMYAAPLRMPPMRNSQNYYPIDPLLAVFLSNYGYYLPGYYGFPGNYYNIYGYLASNNIHNNKPFGAYKIYSDTDSSHK